MSQVKADTTTRQKIISSAKVLFSNHGFGQTSIEDIITSAGITKGAFYHYFKSKESICEEIIDGVKNEYQEVFNSIDKNYNPLEKLKALIFKILELNSSGQWLNCKLMLRIGCESRVNEKLSNFWDWYIEQYRQLIAECREMKLIGTKLSAEQQTNIVISFLTGSIWTKSFLEINTDTELVQKIIENL
jgi:AcrR family transcriptional regulator